MSIYPTPVPQSKGNPRLVPSPNDVGACWIYDGRNPAGILIERDRSFFVFGTDGILVGEYTTRRAALLAIPVNHQS